MVQTCLNRISQEVAVMDLSDRVTYEEKNMTIKVERVFIGEKTAKERVLELLKKRRDAGEFRPVMNAPEPGSGCFVLLQGKAVLKIAGSMCVLKQGLINPLMEEEDWKVLLF